jgi:hypothetical protein
MDGQIGTGKLMIEILLALVVAAVITGTLFAIRASATVPRKVATFVSALAVLMSVALFPYMWVVGSDASSLPLSQRVDAVTPWIRGGSAAGAIAILMACFAVPRARGCLLAAGLVALFLWLGLAGMAV